MTDYEQGFLDACELIVQMGSDAWDRHFKNSQNKTLSQDYQDAALSSKIAVGCLVSDVKCLAAGLARKETAVPIVVEERHWWSTPDHQGKN